MALLFSKCTSVFVVFVLMVLCKSQATSSKPNESSIAKRHGQWTTRYGKVYNSTVEKDKRYKIFKANVQFIDSFNSKRNQPYKLAVNAFADLTNEEFLASRTGLKRSSKPKPLTSFKYENVTDVPPTMDWRSKGAVTPIKDQGDCGSCWAFSTVAAVEGINQLTTGELIELSEQELVDCDTEDYGCRGGTLETAFEFIQQNGIANETLYPYQGDDDNTCNKEAASSIAAKISGYKSVPENSESELLKAVANQPIAAAIDGSGHAFQFYSTGVFTRDCGTKIDHGVAVVGYGTTNDGIKYWLVKNSWGTGWGQEGYILMERDVSISEGLCGIAIEPVYPTA